MRRQRQKGMSVLGFTVCLMAVTCASILVWPYVISAMASYFQGSAKRISSATIQRTEWEFGWNPEVAKIVTDGRKLTEGIVDMQEANRKGAFALYAPRRASGSTQVSTQINEYAWTEGATVHIVKGQQKSLVQNEQIAPAS